MNRLHLLSTTKVILLAAVVVFLPSIGTAQTDLTGHVTLTYRGDGNAHAAVLNVADGTLVYDSASVTPEDPAAIVTGEFAWDLSDDGSSVLLNRVTIANYFGELVDRHLATKEEFVVTPPEGSQLIASTARLDRSGNRVLFQFQDEAGPDPRNMMLGLWSNGASTVFAGDASYEIMAFALAPNGVVAYLALPVGTEDAPLEVFVGNLEDGSFERVGPVRPMPSCPPIPLRVR
jgi:hypothetical protein